MLPELLIILGCLVCLFIYLKTTAYDSVNGIVLLAVSLAILFLRVSAAESVQTLFFVPETLWQAALANGLLILIFIMIMRFLKQRELPSIKYMGLLFVLYLPFGFIQQVFFQYVFLETMNSLIGWFSVFPAAVFFMLFHLRQDFPGGRSSFFVAGLCQSILYLLFGNLICLAVSHAVLGVVYYSLVCKRDALRKRLSILKNVKL